MLEGKEKIEYKSYEDVHTIPHLCFLSISQAYKDIWLCSAFEFSSATDFYAISSDKTKRTVGTTKERNNARSASPVKLWGAV